MKIVETFATTRGLAAGIVGLVPTMGYLHEGHLSLVTRARRRVDTVVVSLFVNPLQFGPGEDLERYPRDIERDAALAADAGADVLFAPGVDEMYPEPPVTRVTVDPLGEGLCGRTRPGHFTGVATVVAKLFAGIGPDAAWFGRKDAQQLAIVRRLAADLSFPVTVHGGPIVRAADGLALSSRNLYLSGEERRAALALSRGLMEAADAVAGGETDGPRLEAMVRAVAGEESRVDLEYAELTDAASVTRLHRVDRPSFLAVAARVGRTRLIDNVHFDPRPGGGYEPDRGVRLVGRGMLQGGA